MNVVSKNILLSISGIVHVYRFGLATCKGGGYRWCNLLLAMIHAVCQVMGECVAPRPGQDQLIGEDLYELIIIV